MNFDTLFLNKLTQILTRLKYAGIVDPVVGGGCLRDMLFEKEIKDIDVFYSKGNYKVLNSDSFLNLATFEELPLNAVSSEEYAESEFKVTNNLKSALIDVPIQLIKVKHNPYKHIDEFPINICRVAYGPVVPGTGFTSYPTLQIPTDVLEDYFSKRIYYDLGISEGYLQRIQEKYHDWEFYT
jgi:hypothetical protein